ncbi:Peptidoglycan-binding protein [Sphingomonas antarctica]|uniref:L,D-transpeptidase family protein n=1 Tax=Sphingomonas antarctica TaxID=2040274 RepID=UPI0039EC20D9
MKKLLPLLLVPLTIGAAAPTTAVNLPVLHVQVILDKLGFSPGTLDGKRGQSLTLALKGFQESRGLATTGIVDQPTLNALLPFQAWRAVKEITLGTGDVAGPYTNPFPHDPAEQAKLPGLYYKNTLEALAERFHTTNATLIALSSRETQLRPGAKITVPNAMPTSRAYPSGNDVWRGTLNSLNVQAINPVAKRLVVDKSDAALRVYGEDDRLIAQFPATMGSSHDPLPIGTWKIMGVDPNPKFRYNPDLFWDAKTTDEKAMLPAGPNGPVGVVWIDLNKPHYGIHGTPEPQTIGRTESHGCIRLTNWDAARLALMVKPGMEAKFQL